MCCRRSRWAGRVLCRWLTKELCRECVRLQGTLGLYTVADIDVLNKALHGFALSGLRTACCDRVDMLRANSNAAAPAAPDAAHVRVDRVSFLILAYACCLNHVQWFVRSEARRLMSRVHDLEASEKVVLLRLLEVEAQPMQSVLLELQTLARKARTLPQQQLLSAPEAERGKRLQGLVKAFADHAVHKPLAHITETEWRSFFLVDFEKATRLVAARHVALHNGSAYVEDSQLLFIVRQTYEASLVAFLQQCKTNLALIAQSKTDYYYPQFATVLHIMHDLQFRVCPVAPSDSAGLACTAQTLPTLIARFAPPCIVRLVMKLGLRGHLVDRERVTLRLWLRAAKVGLDVAVDFWQVRVPDNEDVRRPLALVYTKQYACVGCPKIRSMGLCPFQDADKDLLRWCAETMPSAVRDIEDIVRTTKCPAERCGRMFALRHARRLSDHLVRPGNPASYFLRAAEAELGLE